MAGNNTDQGVKETLRIMKLIGYTLVFIAGVILNVFLLLAVTRKRLRHKNTSKTFIIIMQNLGVADILLLVTTIPFDAAWHETEEFPYGAGMCKILWPFQTACFQAVVFTYVILSFHRTYGVMSNGLFGQLKSIHGYIIVFMVWVASISTVIPYMVFLKHTSGKVESCAEDWEKVEHRQTYTVFLFLLQYFIPLYIMVCLYFITWKNLKYYSHRRDAVVVQRANRHKRVSLMLILYILVFAVLLLPHQIMWFMLDFGNGADEPHFFEVLNFLYVFTYLITVTNVVLFFKFNKEFQSDSWYFLRCYCCRSGVTTVNQDESQSFSIEDVDTSRYLPPPVQNIGMQPYTGQPKIEYDAREAQYNPTASMEL